MKALTASTCGKKPSIGKIEAKTLADTLSASLRNLCDKIRLITLTRVKMSSYNRESVGRCRNATKGGDHCNHVDMQMGEKRQCDTSPNNARLLDVEVPDPIHLLPVASNMIAEKVDVVEDGDDGDDDEDEDDMM